MHSSDSMLSELHMAAVQKESAFALPSIKEEAWRYTDLSLFLKDSFLPVERQAWDQNFQIPQQAELLLDADENLLVFFNGQFVAHSSRTEGASYKLLPQWQTADLQKCFADVDAAENFIRFRNAAQLDGGISLKVEKKADLKLHLLFLYGDYPESEGPFQTAFRTQIEVDERAELSLVETHLAVSDCTFFANSVTDLQVKGNARLDYLRLHGTGDRGLLLNHTHVTQGESSFVDFTQLTLGGRLARNEVVVDLSQPQSDVRLSGLTLTKSSHHVDNSTTVRHIAGSTRSDQVYKNFLCDQSRVVFNGRLVIKENAQKADARQLNQNLILGEKAEVDTRPQLEVFADDVKAAHGASIGQIDEDHIFYMMSRGIGRNEAMRMLAEGFLDDGLNRISRASLRLKAEKLLATSIHEFVRAPS